MISLSIDIKRILNFSDSKTYDTALADAGKACRMLCNKSGSGNEFLGWIDLPEEIKQQQLIQKISSLAIQIRQTSEVVVIVGIGGSYLGARAVIEAMGNPFQSTENTSEKPFVVYAGHNISSSYMHYLTALLDIKEYSIVVISKSGTTTEPAIAFRILKQHIEKKYGKAGAQKRIIAITDKAKGALRSLCNQENYQSYIIPDDVGGRYSVFSPVGLVPVAIAGFNIQQLIEGACNMRQELLREANEKNPACLYAAARNTLYRSGKTIEIMAGFQPEIAYIVEWWKQLYGESEGKNHKGIFPAGVQFTTDLHSMGQYIQDGLRNIFETMLVVEKSEHDFSIPLQPDDADGLNFIGGKSMHFVNEMACKGTMLAHSDGGIPVIEIKTEVMNEFCLGELLYFFEFACGISGYMLDVNPFDQPGVEAYKNNMFALLKKPGYEELHAMINARLNDK